MQNPGPSGYVGQTYTVEYTVNGSLDGTTLGPAIVAPQSNDDPQQIYRPNVPGDLGLIDVDYVVEAAGGGRLGAKGPRVVNVVWIEAPVVGGASAAIQVVDNVDGSPNVQRTIDPLVGVSQFYRDTPFLVPQGSMLRLVDFVNPGGGGGPIKVRLTIQDAENLSAAQAAICSCGGDSISAIITPPSTGLQVVGLNAAFVGSVNDTVGRFDGATVNLGDRALADWVTRNTGFEAANGTEFKITLAGIYGVVGYLATVNDGIIEAGVTLDGTPTVDPVMSNANTLANFRRRLTTLGVADDINASFSGFAMVTAARAGGAATGVIRFQVSNGAGGPPTDPPINADDCVLKIIRLANLG